MLPGTALITGLNVKSVTFNSISYYLPPAIKRSKGVLYFLTRLHDII